jgi:hypothetical protein
LTHYSAKEQLWFQAVVHRRADAAAVNAIASGSQQGTMRAINHRTARSLAAFAPTTVAQPYTDRRGLCLDLPPFGGQRGAFGFQACQG